MQPANAAPPVLKGYPVLTIVLIVLSLLVTFDARMGQSPEGMSRWIIALPGSESLAEVRHGEVWRLLTPILLHFGALHLLFNMMWLWDLGRIIEGRKGVLPFLRFILVIGIASNLVQYGFTGSPLFGGMSGVVYGLLSYFWVLGRYDPGFGFVLQKQTVIMMLGWFVLCWIGLLGPIANWGHTAGLVGGLAWGFLEIKKMKSA